MHRRSRLAYYEHFWTNAKVQFIHGSTDKQKSRCFHPVSELPNRQFNLLNHISTHLENNLLQIFVCNTVPSESTT